MTKKLLIVEDSPTQLEHLRYILEQNSYSVEAARNGKAALQMLQGFLPELIISDIVMPEMDGYALCRSIKENPLLRDIPVMLLTNLSDPQDVIRGLQAGADNFLTKPYNETFLLSRINYILLNKEIRVASNSSDLGINIHFGGKTYFINSDRMQIIDLLLSTYENAIQKNGELAEANKQLINMHHEIARKNAELEKLNDDKSKFLRIAAHDLRNPVAAIMSFSNLILEGDARRRLGADELEFLSIIKDSSEFVLTMLNDLLDISVIETGQLQLNKAETDLKSLIQKNTALNKVLADKKQILLRVDLGAEGESMLTVDPVKIEQVLNNLISNAIKFSFPGGEVTVRLAEVKGEFVISVQDRGQGIPRAEQAKLFMPFSRTSVKTTAGERSTGLGLSIVKKIVETHGGRIWLESEVNKGSTFYVALPQN